MSDEKQQRKRNNVINEIITSEASYNSGLQLMNKLVKEPLLQKIRDDDFIPHLDEKIPQLFQALSQILIISDRLNDELYQVVLKKQTIGEAFSSFSHVLTLYFEYIGLYHTALPILSQARHDNKQFNDFITAAEEKAGSETSKCLIESYLITPVQRPPRYKLLLDTLLKTYPQYEAGDQTTSGNKQDDDDYRKIKTAYDTLCARIAQMDEKTDAFEEAERMCKLQSRLKDIEIFVPQRRLLFEGEALKFSRSRTEMRYIIIFSDVLIIAENTIISNAMSISTSAANQQKQKDNATLDVSFRKIGFSLKLNKEYKTGEYLIHDFLNQGVFINSVDILQNRKSFRMNLENPAAKKDILDAFQKVKEMNPYKFTVDQIYAPVWVPDALVPKCMVCDTPFTLFNRRHHCRNCGACICRKCFKKTLIPGRAEQQLGVCTNCFIRIHPNQPVPEPITDFDEYLDRPDNDTNNLHECGGLPSNEQTNLENNNETNKNS